MILINKGMPGCSFHNEPKFPAGHNLLICNEVAFKFLSVEEQMLKHSFSQVNCPQQ